MSLTSYRAAPSRVNHFTFSSERTLDKKSGLMAAFENREWVSLIRVMRRLQCLATTYSSSA